MGKLSLQKKLSIAVALSIIGLSLTIIPSSQAVGGVSVSLVNSQGQVTTSPMCGETVKVRVSGLNAGTYNVGIIFTEVWSDGTLHDLNPPTGVNRATKLGQVTVTPDAITYGWDSQSSDLVWGWGSDKGAAVTAGSYEEMMPCLSPTVLYVDRGTDPLPINSQAVEQISNQIKAGWQRGGSFTISGSGYQYSYGGLGTFYKGRSFTVTDDRWNWGLPASGSSDFSGHFKAYAIAQPDSNVTSFWNEWYTNNGANKQLFFGGTISNGRLTITEYAQNLAVINTDANEKVSVLTYFYGNGSAGKDAGWYLYEYTTITNPPGGISAPSAPNQPQVTAGDGSATITVSDSGSGGTPDSFTVTANPGGLTCSVTGASGSCTISGLTNGTSYTFTATATNSGGTSASSSTSSAVTPTDANTVNGNNGGNNGGGSTPTSSSSASSSTLAAGELSGLAVTPPTTPPSQGSSTTTVGGTSVRTTTSSSDASDSVTSSNGGTYSSSVTFKDIDDGNTVPLTTNDTIGAEPGSDLSITGRGFKGRSQVQVYLIDANGKSTYLGKINTSLFGRVKGKLPVPATLASGKYTLQLNGYTKKNQLVKSTNLGMEVVQDDLGSLYFEADSASATDETKTAIKEMAKSLDAGETVILYGYTSGNPDTKYRAINMYLAKKRTNTVKSLFAAEGVKATIVIEPQGAVSPFGSGGGHAKNRRVDVKPSS